MMRANYSLLISWLQIWRAARSTGIAFAYLAIPFAFTCCLAELKRRDWQQEQRVVGCITYIENGQSIALVSSRTPGRDQRAVKQLVQRCNLSTGKVENLVAYCTGQDWSTCWLSQSGRVVSPAAMNALWSLELATRQVNKVLCDELEYASDIQISQDGQYIVSLADESLRVYHLARGLHAAAFREPMWQSLKYVESFAITTDGTRLFYVQRDNSSRWLSTVDMETGTNALPIAQVSAPADRIVVTADASEVMVVSGLNVHCFSLNTTSRALPTTTLTTGLTKVVTISPKCERIVTTTHDAMHLLIWNRAALSKPQQIASSVPISGAQFLDEEHVLTWSLENKLLIWSLETNNVEREIML